VVDFSMVAYSVE